MAKQKLEITKMNSEGSKKRFLFERISILCLVLILLLPVSAFAQRVVRTGVDGSLPPFSFVDQDSNSIRGFNVDLTKMLAATLGAKIKFFPLESDELTERLVEGKIDLMIEEKTGTHPNLQALDLPFHLERKLFVNNCCITITCVRDLPGRTLVVLKGSNLSHLIPQPERVKLIEVDRQEEALKLVNSGEAEVYLCSNGLSAIYSIQKNNLRNIKEVGIPVETVPLAIWVRQDNMPLLTELSVAFGKITENKTYDTIHRKWFGQNIPFAYFEKYFKIILVAIGFFAIALLGFFIYNQMLKKKVRQVTHDLQLSEQKHKDLIEFSPEMIHLVSPDGRVVHANKITLQMLGYSREVMTSKKMHDLVPPGSQKEVEAFIHSIFQTGSGKKEFAFCANDGRRIDVEMSATLVKGMDKLLACCFSRDMTEHKRLEAELMQSERLALMGEMAAGIAHEINNPLGIILANTEELLQETKNQDNHRESLETIERNAIRAGKFIEDLLTFTRPGLPARVQIDLLSLINESLFLCKQQLRQKQIHVSKEFPENSIFFEGDDNQIQQLFVNLLLNSIQAISEKGTIRIRVRREQDNGTEKIHLEIADTGMGIPEKDLPRIFDPFFTARKNKGFGLGLSISKRIIEKHNGTIRVESKVGQGTIIFVDLPTFLLDGLAGSLERI
jgi:PAS domain S-box-containing protein